MVGLVPFDPTTLILIALLNPVVIVVAVLMGRAADQWQKLIVAAFAASIAGVLAVYLASFTGIVSAKSVGGQGGLLVMQFIVGLIWSAIAYRFFHAKG